MKKYSETEINAMAKETGNIVKKYVNKESKWRGNIRVGLNEVQYGKLWNCDIATTAQTAPHILLHEQIHSCSISHFDIATYAKFHNIEEAAVQFAAQEISKVEGIQIIESKYDDMADALRSINSKLKICEGDMIFAQKLIETPIPQRLDWLEDSIYDKMKNSGTLLEYQEVEQLLLLLR